MALAVPFPENPEPARSFQDRHMRQDGRCRVQAAGARLAPVRESTYRSQKVTHAAPSRPGSGYTSSSATRTAMAALVAEVRSPPACNHRCVTTGDDLVAVDLTEQERYVVVRGFAEWGGPARSTDALAVAMGFKSTEDLHAQARRLSRSVAAGEPLSRQDWRRCVIATEIVFVSDVFGSGVDWQTTTGLADEQTVKVLRSIQRKVARAARIRQL